MADMTNGASSSKGTQLEAETRNARKVRTGTVVSDKMQKTVVVAIERRVKHPVYGKIVMRSNRYKAHDETNQYNEGDTVEIAEGRPISRDKSWTVVRLLTAAHVI